MNGSGVRLGRIAGVEVSANAGVLIIGAFLAWSLSANLLPLAVPGRVPLAYWSVGILGALMFLVSLLLHELSHSVVARRNGVVVEGITLWLFGGVATLKGDPPGPGAEFRIAAAGPAASFVIGALLWASSLVLGIFDGPDTWVVMLAWLGLINVVLAVFNLLPGSPLDGGRILGAVLWKLRGDRASGRLGAAKAGRVIAYLLIGVGIAEMFVLRSFGGLWTAMIGWFLLNAARAEAAYYGAEKSVSGLTVAAAMLSPVQTATTWMTVNRAVEGPFAHSSQTVLPVVDANHQVRGLLFLDVVKRLPAEAWGSTMVSDVMASLEGVSVLDPAESMAEAVHRIGPWGHGLVLDGERGLVGLVGPAEVQRAAELGPALRHHDAAAGGPPPPPAAAPQQHWQPPHAHG